MSLSRRLPLAAASLLLACGVASAQASNQGPSSGRRAGLVQPRPSGWSDRFDQAGLLGRVFAVDTYRGELVAGGLAIQADNDHFGLAATFDGATWRRIGGGIFGDDVRAFAIHGGDLVAAGELSSAGGQPVNGIARWDGSEWHAFGAGLDLSYAQGAEVFALAVYEGELYAGGEIDLAGGAPVSGIARWDGVQWHAVGSGVQGVVRAMHVGRDGLLYVGGEFASAGGVAGTQNLAAWDGGAWLARGGGLPGPLNVSVWDLATYQGEVWAAGNFDVPGGAFHEKVAIFDGASWRAAGNFPDTSIGTLAYALEPWDGAMYVGGNFAEVSGVPVQRMARFDGASWQSVGGVFNTSINQLVFDMSVWNDRLVIGGEFNQVGTDFFGPDADAVISNSIGAFDGAAWSPVGTGLGFNAPVRRAVPWNGGVVALGTFTAAGHALATGPVFLGPDGWRALGRFDDPVADALELGGELVVTGAFDAIDDVPISGVARYDGAQWHQLGGGAPSAARLEVHRGDLYALGSHLWRWDGQTWTQLGPQVFGVVTDLHSHGGLLYASRVAFTSDRVLVWDGQTLSPVPNGPDDTVNDLASFGGELIAAGDFQQVGGTPAPLIARWNGSSWAPFDQGLTGTGAGALAVLRGDLYAAGNLFVPGQPPEKYVARWDGAGWSPLGTGLDGQPVTLAADDAAGLLWAGGFFSHAGGNISWYFGEYAVP